MNYIHTLQKELAAIRDVLREMDDIVVEFRTYLAGPKFVGQDRGSQGLDRDRRRLAAQQDSEQTEREQDTVSTFEGTFGVVIEFPGRGRIADAEEVEEPDAVDVEAG